jgi:hypothetical protein
MSSPAGFPFGLEEQADLYTIDGGLEPIKTFSGGGGVEAS